jgi:hypothetical protein
MSVPPAAAVRVVAIDWSGDARNSQRKIWLGEADQTGLCSLENGRKKDAIGDYLVEMACQRPEMVVGLDFAFSVPAWFLNGQGVADVREFWQLAAERCERWLSCSWPFWGRPKSRKPQLTEHFRRTELEQAAIAGIRPKSVFQVGGAGAVGTGSLRGMALLERVSQAGFHIWPFDRPGWPLVVEIYPRLLTGPVNKRSLAARCEYLQSMPVKMPLELGRIAASNEDAFDAAVSAVQMARHVDDFLALASSHDEQTRLEGKIWRPEPAGDGRC